MPAIWNHHGNGWSLMAPSGFPDEAALHELVAKAPQVLPLAGAPALIILGREVLLGGNYADLIAVESTGRLTIIEIKLQKNAEARRAVIAQVLTYAAALHGVSIETLEKDVLASQLKAAGVDAISGAAKNQDQSGSFDHDAFTATLQQCLNEGGFRLVIVLDDAPAELVRIAGFLESVTDKLLIDLVTVSAYDVGGSRMIVPQRVDPGLSTSNSIGGKLSSQAVNSGRLVDGASDFESSFQDAPLAQRAIFEKLTNWAKNLENNGLVRLSTYHGSSGRLTLLPRLLADNVGLVTIWSDKGPYLQFWRSVIERRAPEFLPALEQLALPAKIGQGTVTKVITDSLLEKLSDAYRTASKGRLTVGDLPKE